MEFAVVLVVIAALVMILIPTDVFHGRGRHNARRSSCASNLKQIGVAFAQYNNDYDDKFPLISRPEGWVGLLQPYLKTELNFQCPAEELRSSDNLTDYWFNRRLAGVEKKRVATADLTILTGDGEPSDDPNVSLILLPPPWIERENSPANRHLEGANYGFADGHVKWFRAKRMAATEKEENAPSLLIR